MIHRQIGIIFYNHPPGRHNIGADNLDVVDSLFDLLHEMKRRGYSVGELPESPEQLLDWLQTRAVNLPEDREALSAMSERVVTISKEQYERWFQTLPSAVRREMVGGPLAALSIHVRQALDAEQIAREFATLVIEHGLPGSGHTRPDHPMLEWIEPKLTPELQEQLRNVRAAARVTVQKTETDPAVIREIEMAETQQPPTEQELRSEAQDRSKESNSNPTSVDWMMILAAAFGLLSLTGGLVAGLRGVKRSS